MKIQLKKLWVANPTLHKIFNTEYSDIKTSYWLSKISKKLNPEIEMIEKSRMDILKKYSKEDKNGKIPLEGKRVNITNEQAFVNDFNELLETEIDIEKIDIRLETLNEAKLKPYELNVISEIINIIESPEDEVNKILTQKPKQDKIK